MTVTALPMGLTVGTWTIDPSHSEAAFTVRHAGISKVRGSVPIGAGQLVITGQLTNSTATATFDAAGVTTNDVNRDAHLRTGDFFDVENHPTWTFTSAGVRGDGPELVLIGDLTVRGVTRTVELEVTANGVAQDPFGNTRAGFEATTTISRKDFGVTWNAVLETGGFLVADKVRIDLDISAIRQ